MNRLPCAFVCIGLCCGAVHAAEVAGVSGLVSGVETQYIDESVRAQDDF